MATEADAESRDIYWFFDLNEAIDVASDCGDYGLRPPITEERLAEMKAGKASVVRIPRALLEMLQ